MVMLKVFAGYGGLLADLRQKNYLVCSLCYEDCSLAATG